MSETTTWNGDLRRAKRAPQRGAPTNGDRLPPHAEEAERGVVGCILLQPSECLDALDEMGMQGEWFYVLRCQKVFEVARGMHFRQPPVPVDLITLSQELRQLGLLEEIGGIAFLNELQDGVPSAVNVSYYAEQVREEWQRRTVVRVGTELAVAAQEHEGQVGDLLEAALGELSRLAELQTRRSEQRIKVVLQELVIPKLEGHYTRGRAQLSGLVTTGLEYLDKIFCGLGGDNGNYHVFAARPNVGKTSLITGMALHAALDFEWNEEVPEATARAAEAGGAVVIFNSEQHKWFVKRRGVPVGISSLEMGAESLGQKMLFQRARADLQRWRNGYATNADFPPLIAASGALQKADNILIDDTARENIGSIKAKWRRWHRQHGVRFFMLDYIQLIKSSSKRFRPDRVQEMEEISAELQALGKELNCPMAILAQLNRDYEKEPNRLPRLSDLKNCGAIEQDADSVTMLYKPSPYKPFSKEYTEEHEFFAGCMEKAFGPKWKKWDARPERINALVEKNKHGPKGDAKLLFLKSSTLFVDYTQWLKEKGYVQPAKGEESRYPKQDQAELGEDEGKDD